MKHKYAPFVLIALSIFFAFTQSNCKKNESLPPDPPPVTNTDSTLNKNVIIIDSTNLILISDTSLINQGHIEYNIMGNAPDIKVNDIVVGATHGGYIRKVSSVNKQQNKIIIESTQGTMEDVFSNASFNFSLGTDDKLTSAKVMSEYAFDISGSTLYKNGPITIKLEKGLVNVGGDWNFDFDFKKSKLENFVMECKNASFTGQFEFNVTANQSYVADTTVILKRVAKSFIKVVNAGLLPIPIVVYMEVELRGKVSASIESTVEEVFNVNSNTTMNLGLSYSNSQWQTTYNKTSSSSVEMTKFSDKLKAKLELGLIPYISFRLYRVAGPYASFGLRELLKHELTLPAGDWDIYAGAWLQTTVGARAGIFSKSLVDYNKEWNTDTMYYQTPDNIIRVSGDNQLGFANEYLDKPLQVRVLNFKGNGEAKVPVYFTVTSGGGSVETKSVLTDENGYAQTRWKIGAKTSIETVEATVKKGNGTLINGAPIEFAASAKPKTVPILSTGEISSISSTSAVSGGNITEDGGSLVTARGICWSTSPNPTITNSKTNDGTGKGSFVSSIKDLAANTTYYARAYATNSMGTGYGNEISFTTLQINLPTLTTNEVSSITQTSAIAGGNITNDGGADVISRGVCWSTSSNPTIALLTKTNDGAGSGSFVSNIKGLIADTTYYVRAYATNSAGTAYGNEVSFKTETLFSLGNYTGTYTWRPPAGGVPPNSPFTLSLTNSNGIVSGTMTANNAVTYSLTGTLTGTTLYLTNTNWKIELKGTLSNNDRNITGTWAYLEPGNNLPPSVADFEVSK